MDKENTAGKVWGDTAYRSKENEILLEVNGFVSRIHRKKPKGRAFSQRILKANSKKSKIRCKVELVFAVQKELELMSRLG